MAAIRNDAQGNDTTSHDHEDGNPPEYLVGMDLVAQAVEEEHKVELDGPDADHVSVSPGQLHESLPKDGRLTESQLLQPNEAHFSFGQKHPDRASLGRSGAQASRTCRREIPN